MSNKPKQEPNISGTLNITEPHPASYEMLEKLKTTPIKELLLWKETFASLALSGNRLGEICNETLGRILNNEPVSDRYVLGLAVTMFMNEGDTNNE